MHGFQAEWGFPGVICGSGSYPRDSDQAFLGPEDRGNVSVAKGGLRRGLIQIEMDTWSP